MRTAGLVASAVIALSSLGCGATTRSTASGAMTTVTLTTATVTFMTRDDGKDEDSAIAVQLLDDEGRLAAEATVVDVDFEDKTVSQALNLVMSRTLTGSDVDDARLRLRLTPDGRDTWTFDMRANVRLSDGTERQYFWSGLRLDEGAPERTLALSSGRMQ
jgi:ABC-type transport system substrate-binding protein